MSKLIDKGKGINFDDDDEPAPSPAAAPKSVAGPRTAIGAISASLALGRGVEAENRALKERLQEFEDATVVEFIDPRRIRASRYANRHELSFQSAEFERLKAEIASAGRNVQPIKVRKVGAVEPGDSEFEVAFGHRRHRACLELGIPVAAVVEELTDEQLFAEMDRENRERQNLAPWEQGVMYKRALDSGLFPSLRKLAAATGAQVGNVSTALQLAALPDDVVNAFGSPLMLQYRWAAPLKDALDRDADAVLREAGALAKLEPRLAAKEVFDRLTGVQASTVRPAPLQFEFNGEVVGQWEKDAKGNVLMRLKGKTLSPAKEKKLLEFITRLLA